MWILKYVYFMSQKVPNFWLLPPSVPIHLSSFHYSLVTALSGASLTLWTERSILFRKQKARSDKIKIEGKLKQQEINLTQDNWAKAMLGFKISQDNCTALCEGKNLCPDYELFFAICYQNLCMCVWGGDGLVVGEVKLIPNIKHKTKRIFSFIIYHPI